MSLFQQVAEFFRGKSVSQLARGVVNSCHAAVRMASEARALQMCPAEARGYIRAKATPFLREAIENLVQRHTRVAAWARLPIQRLASDQLVEMVLGDILSRQRALQPRRRAA